MGLRGIPDDLELMLACQLPDALDVTYSAVQVNGDYSSGFRAYSDPCIGKVDRPTSNVHIAEDRNATGHQDGACRGEKCESWNEYLVAGRYQGLPSKVESRRARADSYRVPDANCPCKAILKLAAECSLPQTSRPKDLDNPVDFRLRYVDGRNPDDR
jgi:hypothetical protein